MPFSVCISRYWALKAQSFSEILMWELRQRRHPCSIFIPELTTLGSITGIVPHEGNFFEHVANGSALLKYYVHVC